RTSCTASSRRHSMRALFLLGVTLGAFATLAPACASRESNAPVNAASDAAAGDAAPRSTDAAEVEDAGPEIVGAADAGPIRVVDGGSAVCANATPIPTDSEAHR